MNPDNLIEILIELLTKEITPELLNCTKLTKILRYFIKSYSKSDDSSLKTLAKLIKIIYFKWKNVVINNALNNYKIKTEKISDPGLKEQVCKRVIEILRSNGFELNESETLAISIEHNIRKRDPTMKEQYIKDIKRMIKDIKTLDRISYLSIGKTL